MFDNIADPDRRVLVDVAEFPGPVRAGEYIAAAREDANFEVSGAAIRFGTPSLAFPKATPRTLYFCLSNLAIWVYSCGRERLDVEPWADQIVADLNQPPPHSARPDLIFNPEPSSPAQAGAIRLRPTLQWDRGEWAWSKFKAVGATISRAAIDSGDLLVWPTNTTFSIAGVAIEPGRETYVGEFKTGT
jgi:hypothetical protein